MKLLNCFVGGLLATLASAQQYTGKSYTGWDCCKPACSWSVNLNNGAQGIVGVCDINNNPLGDPALIESGCNGGTAFLCDSYQPTPVEEDLSYGFALQAGVDNCCKCYKLMWTSGAATGKSMVVQIINGGEPSGEMTYGDIVILTPGGGDAGNSGCRSQYGTTWGDEHGGVTGGAECADLPQNLQGGCYWRYNWGRGTLNGWDITYDQVDCPSRLTSISGCYN